MSDAPIDRVRALFEDADPATVAQMGEAMANSYSVPRNSEFVEFMESKGWTAGEEMTVMAMRMAEAMVNLDEEYRSSLLVTFIGAIVPMIDVIEEELRKGTH